MKKPAMRSSDYVLSFLAEARVKLPNTEADGVLRQRYRQAAAVLTALKEPERLAPVGGGGKPGEGVRLLGEDLIQATGRRLGGTRMLRPDVRRAALEDLSSPNLRRNALLANPAEREGSLQQDYEAYLLRTPGKRTGPEDLENTLQIALWLEGLIEGAPRAEEVRLRLAQRNLLAPFEAIAGDSIFRGRKNEIDQLRTYVGVLSPERLLQRFLSKTRGWLQPDAMPALSVSGPGGVGKSSLVGRFLLEHSRLPDEARLPFAYLDFDRPTLNIAEPAGLVAEMLYQLELQYPQFNAFRDLRNLLVRSPANVETQPSDEITAFGAEDENGLGSLASTVLADMLGTLQALLGPRPYVLVLDTFEEVQYQGEARAFPVWELLTRMQSRWPFLRVVVSGRAPVTTLFLAGKAPQTLVLGDLDHEAAIGFLRANGVDDPAIAEAVARQIGGVPLSLKLAASVLRENGAADQSGIREFEGRSRFWFSPADEVIQGQLYERILGRLHDPRLERLAHPGLVLRRVDMDVILHVLNDPCQLGLASLDEAAELFDELRKETSLVVVDTTDGSLVHRPDLRRMMLKLLVQKAPAQVETIRRAAVAWYSAQRGWRARAEELYHRLQLGESVDSVQLRDPELRASLQISIVELPLTAQIMLASYGLKVADNILAKASQEERERHAAAEIEQLLPFGPSSVELAGKRLDREKFRGRSSWLYASAARVAQEQNENLRALSVVDEGLRWAVLEGNTMQVLQLAANKAWFLRLPGVPVGGRKTGPMADGLKGKLAQSLAQAVTMLGEYAQRHADQAARVQYLCQAFELSTFPGKGAAEFPLLSELAQALKTLEPEQCWSVWPALAGLLAPLLQVRPDAALVLRDLLLADSSPFQRVEFADARLQRKLAVLLRGVQSGSLSWVDAAQDLDQVWPFRNLYVPPPYGTLGFESAPEMR